MRKVNKVLILFLFVLTLLFMLTWEMLQSRWVANYVSSIATKYVAEVLDAEIKFENLEFTLFPPGADVKNISLKAKKKELEIDIEANKLGVYFNPFDIFETDFIVDRIYIEDGRIAINKPENSDDNKEAEKRQTEINLDFFDSIFAAPINKIELEKIDINYNEFNVFGRDLIISNKKKFIELLGTLEHLSLKPYLEREKHIDSLYLDLKIDKKELTINDAVFKSGFVEFEAKGSVDSYVSKNIEYKLTYKLRAPLNSIHEYVDLSNIGRLDRGIVSADGKFVGVGEDFKAEIKIQGEKIITDFANADEINLNAVITKKQIKLDTFVLYQGDSRLELTKPFELFNFNTKKFVEEPIVVRMKKLSLANTLKYLRDSLNILEGKITGLLRFDLFERSYSFKFLEKSRIEAFNLKVDDKLNAFELKNFDIQDGVINVVEGNLDLSLSVASEDTQVTVIAGTDKGAFFLSIPNSFVNLEKISPILGYNLKGKGILNVQMKNNIVSINADINRMDFNSYSLDKVKGEADIDLSHNHIHIKRLFGSSGKSIIKSKGKINLEDQTIAATYEIQDASFSEVKKVLKPLMQDVQITTNEIYGNWNLAGKITGGTDLSRLVVTGRLQGKNTYFFDENFENLDFQYSLKNEIIKIDNFQATKSGGEIGLDFSYNFISDLLSFSSNFKKIPFQELTWYKRLPFTLKGELQGDITGEYFKNKWKIDSEVRLKDTYSFGLNYPDSLLRLSFDENKVKADFNLFDSQVEINSELFLDEKNAEYSYLNLDLNVPNMRNLFGLISVVDLSNSDLSGRIKYSLRSRFNPLKRKFSDIETNMMNFVLNKKPISIRYKNPSPEIIVKNGEIIKWDVDIKGNKLYVISKGEGNIFKDFNITTQSKVDASIIEIFNNIINKATGNIRLNVNYGYQGDREEYQAYLSSNNLSVISEYLPTAVTKADFKISFNDKVFEIEKFNAQLVTGTLELDGKLSLKSLIPDINIRYKFKDAGLTLFKKSNLVFSGEGSFVGKNFPYTLGGDYYIEKFVLVNEITDFGGAESTFVKEDVEYLPGSANQSQEQLINLNLNISTRNPIFVRNSLADLGFNGAVQITGSEELPFVRGQINLAARNNKVTFKNNDFILTKGSIFFNEQNEYSNPELDFAANTFINEYNVHINVIGPVRNFKVDLNSEPALAQSDILSLIAFGYTEDLSNSLSDGQRESMTKAGVGSIIFDSFKINETLKKEFGLQVNLGTQISQEEGSLLTGRNSDGAGNTGRVRSATTLEIKKNLSDALSLSVSSTVDTSTEQKQSMNLNYNINRNISIEGVYESRNTDDVETINLDNSIGADIKWKWSFK